MGRPFPSTVAPAASVVLTALLLAVAVPAAASGATGPTRPASRRGSAPAVARPLLTQGPWVPLVPTDPDTSGTLDTEYNAVSCVDADLCLAVGDQADSVSAVDTPVAARWDGSSWTALDGQLPAPPPGDDVDPLEGISCVSMTWCMAVGSTEGSGKPSTWAVVWNGSTWSTVITPDPGTGPAGNAFGAVSCASTTFCVAIDEDAPGGRTSSQLMQWNGSGWTSAVPPGLPPNSSLNGVSCTSTTCQAVGQEKKSSTAVAYGLVGGSWTEEPVPTTAADGTAVLDSVACVTATWCTAVGSQVAAASTTGSSQNLVETWNGQAWAEVAVPDADATFGDGLDGVACLGPEACTAVGTVDTASSGDDYQDQALAWDGTSWVVADPPTDADPTDALLAVACSADAACLGVGYADDDAQAVRASAARPGYLEVAADGGIFAFGGAPFAGSAGGWRLTAPVVGVAETPDGGGYWEVAADGGVFAFGDAGFFGSMGGAHLVAPVVGLVPTPDGQGYWEVAADGGVFAFGDAGFFGSIGGHRLVAGVVGLAASPDGQGYWEVAADGGVFAFGDAGFAGSVVGLRLAAPVVGMAVDPSGGYWEVAADGGVFALGGASFAGSMGGMPLQRPLVGIGQ